MAKYYVWTETQNDKYVWVTDLPSFMVTWKDGYLAEEGVPLSEIIPPDRVFELDKNRGSVLPDVIPNTCGVQLVSKPLRDFLEKESGAAFEFIPVQVKDQRGRLLDESYFIANLLGPGVPLDRQKSDVDWSFRPNKTSRIRRLVLDSAKIPPDAKLFRLAERGDVILVREDLVRKIVGVPFKGAFFRELDDYGSEWR